MEHYGFFDGENLYGQDDLNRYYSNMFENGVSIIDGAMTMKVSANNTDIEVEEGFAIVEGFYLYNDSIKTISISRNNDYDRIDRIVIRLDLSDKKVSIEHKQGAAGSNPQPPTLQRDNLIYELSLAQVKVPKSGTIVVTDERFIKALCGAIRPKNYTELNDMMEGFSDEFERWFNNQQGLGWRNIYIQEDGPVDAVVGSIWIELT